MSTTTRAHRPASRARRAISAYSAAALSKPVTIDTPCSKTAIQQSLARIRLRAGDLQILRGVDEYNLTTAATRWIISAVPPRSTVGHLPLEQGIGVRIPGGQPNPSFTLPALKNKKGDQLENSMNFSGLPNLLKQDRHLAPDKPRIKTARDSGVSRAFNDGAAIGKQS